MPDSESGDARSDDARGASGPGWGDAVVGPGADVPGDQVGETATSWVDRLLGRLPALLSSKTVIFFGIFLFFYLFVFAGLATLLGHPSAVSANVQLILGNYTNVSSSVGAGIAAGTGVALVRRQRRTHAMVEAAHRAAEEARAFAVETHRLLHLAHPTEAAALGQVGGQLGTPPAEAHRADDGHPADPGR